MGKHLIRATRWSWRSLLSVYSRLMTLLFALFCAATGLLPKSASAKESAGDSTVFKGTAYRASDSTVLGNIRLYLQECAFPLYGIFPDYGIAPEYGVAIPTLTVDSVVTDENGNFEAVLPGTGDATRGLVSEEVVEPDGRTIYSSTCVTIMPGTDSTYTLYLVNTTTAAEKKADRSVPAAMTALRGNELQILIPEWKGLEAAATIVNSRGQVAATITADPDGLLRWNTGPVAKGIYFLRLHSEQANLSVKILVK